MTLLLLISMMLAMPLQAQSPYFCDREGAVLHYERRHADSGKLKWTHEMTIASVTETPDGCRAVSYESEFRRPGGGRMYGGLLELSAVIDRDGGVQVDVAASLASVFRNLLPDGAVSAEPCMTLLPADMRPGDILPDASCTVGVAMAEYDVTVSARKVLRSEVLSTPAGDFDCVVVSEHKVEKGPGRNRVTTALTWYARGTGMVRHDTYDRNMELETSEVLIGINCN